MFKHFFTDLCHLYHLQPFKYIVCQTNFYPKKKQLYAYNEFNIIFRSLNWIKFKVSCTNCWLVRWLCQLPVFIGNWEIFVLKCQKAKHYDVFAVFSSINSKFWPTVSWKNAKFWEIFCKYVVKVNFYELWQYNRLEMASMLCVCVCVYKSWFICYGKLLQL